MNQVISNKVMEECYEFLLREKRRPAGLLLNSRISAEWIDSAKDLEGGVRLPIQPLSALTLLDFEPNIEARLLLLHDTHVATGEFPPTGVKRIIPAALDPRRHHMLML